MAKADMLMEWTCVQNESGDIPLGGRMAGTQLTGSGVGLSYGTNRSGGMYLDFNF